MIINKWPEPMNFKVEAQVKKEPWSQTFIRYVRGMDEEKPKLPLRRTQAKEDVEEETCEGEDCEPENEADDVQDASCEVEPCGATKDDEVEGEEEMQYKDLVYFLVIMAIQAVFLCIICVACAIYRDRMQEAELERKHGGTDLEKDRANTEQTPRRSSQNKRKFAFEDM